MFTKYGYFTIGIVTIIAFILIAISIFCNNGYVKYTSFTLAVGILVFTLQFFRDPERTSVNRDDVVLSPADGTVLIIKNVTGNKFINEDAQQISIFMSPLNVHVNRIPITGKVEYLKYIKGEYLVASHDKADERNERCEIGITGKIGKVFFTQVAGMVARRIIYELSIGDSVEMGKRFGMIKFGSRVDVVVPKSFNAKVNVGDKVTAGETILFECNK
ncbi:MAG: phosphatidylserine decarboxylase family protein [Melioribacteraceae bacterium]|nr:phosphatidylserine decarboxylase family protein [Melioribacteraceae bacterium]